MNVSSSSISSFTDIQFKREIVLNAFTDDRSGDVQTPVDQKPENPLPFTGCDNGEMAAFFLMRKGIHVAPQKSDVESRLLVETSQKTQDKDPRTSTDFSKAELKTFHEALAGGKLKPLEDALKNKDLTAAQVYAVLAPKDDRTWATLRALIGKRTESPEELHQKRSAFKAYVELLKEHAPRLTASQLKDLYQYLHFSQYEFNGHAHSSWLSKGYKQLKEDRALYHEFKDLKTLLKNAKLPGSSDLDMGYKEISAEIRTLASRLKDAALDEAQRYGLLVGANADKPPLLQRLLALPIGSAFSIEYKRSAFRQYFILLAQHTPSLKPELRKRLYGALHDSQKAPRWIGKTNSEGYRQVMRDEALQWEYRMLKACLKWGGVMQDSPTGSRFVDEMWRRHAGSSLFTGALGEECL